MARKKFALVLINAILLASCGGGSGDSGVNSTPTPTPTPSPTPTPTPTPNTSLSSLTYSESFANSTASGVVSFPTSGAAPTASAGAATATIAYDAATRGYTLTVGTRSQTFLPANLDASQSSAQLAVYTKTNGSTTDTLSLTKPGTSGRFTYQYVGGGFWQRTITGSSTISGSFDAFAYGVTTSNIALPRTGRAEYAVDLIGVENTSSNVFAIVGQGVAQVDFARASIVTHGTAGAAITGTGKFSSEAALSSNANSFAGTFRFDDFGLFKGTLNGNFYGPAAEEFGAAFSASQSDGRVMAGALIGRGAAVTSTNATVKAPTVNEFYTADAARITTTLRGGSGSNNGGETFSSSATALDSLIVNYDASSKAYSVIASDRSQYFLGDVSLGSVSEGLVSSQPVNNLQGFPNSVLTNLQYATSMRWKVATSQGSSTQYRIEDMVFGQASANSALPRTGGTLGYTIGLSGTLADANFPNLGYLTGLGTVKANFSTGTITLDGQLLATEDYTVSGRARGSVGGTFSGSATLSSSENSFNGNISLDGLGAYAGTLKGRFYGPAADEVGGAFSASNGNGGGGQGTFVGGQDAGALAGSTPLASLTAATTLSFKDGQSDVGGPSLGQITAVKYDPAVGGYTLSINDTHLVGSTVYTVDLGTATRDAANSNASFDAFAGTVGGQAYTASQLKPDATNPTLALTYTSLATLVATKVIPDRDVDPRLDRHYVAFGLATTNTQMPITGSYTYSGIARGVGMVTASPSETTYYDLTGTASLAVNFATTSVSSTLNLTGNAIGVSKPTITFNGLTASGNVSGNGFSTNNGVLALAGTFFGPKAEEMGASFRYFGPISGVGTVNLDGAVVGKR